LKCHDTVPEAGHLFIFIMALDLLLTKVSKGRLSGGAASTVDVWDGSRTRSPLARHKGGGII
jgi:hypothetical protein